MSSAIETIKEFIRPEDTSVQDRYRCNGCGNEFESAKDPDRAQCPDCLDRDVERIGG